MAKKTNNTTNNEEDIEKVKEVQGEPQSTKEMSTEEVLERYKQLAKKNKKLSPSKKILITVTTMAGVVAISIPIIAHTTKDRKYIKPYIDFNIEQLNDTEVRLPVDAKVGDLSIQNIEGYRFDGWYSDKDHTNKLYLTQTLSDIKVIYGKYIKLINVTLNVAGTETTLVVDEGTDVNTFADIEADIIEGYEFEGWYLDEEFTKPVTEITGLDTQLYARIPNLPESYLTETADGEGYQVIRSTTDTLDGISTLVIPSTYNGKPVTEIVDGETASTGVFSQSNITKISLPNTMIKIGSAAFSYCDNLKDINIPSSVTTLGSICFAYTGLTNINIPNTVTTFGTQMFYGCTSLESVKLPNNMKTIPQSMFYKCSLLNNVVLPTELEELSKSCFYGCTSLQNITINDNMKIIGVQAFYNCSSLNNVELPANLTQIGQLAFNGCSSLSSITIPDSVIYVGNAAFQNCKALEKIIGFDKLNVEFLGTHVFNGCESLKTFSLPMNIDIIPANMFCKCKALTSIKISSHITKISQSAFIGCSGLTSVEIQGVGAWKITDNADYTEGDVIDITDVEANATNLTTDYAEYYWYNSSMYTQTTGTLPSSWLQFDEDKEEYTVIRGADILPNNLTIPKLYNGYPIVAIADNAFKNCTSLFSVEFEEGSLITRIGENAFNSTGISNIIIPSGVTIIEEYAFYGCVSLQSVTLSVELETVGYGAFMNSLRLVDITIPSKVIKIGINAFDNTAIKNIIIPSSVKYIGQGAFTSCGNLETITFESPDNWYKTSSNTYTGGELIDVSNVSQNATWFKSKENNEYTEYYWYKEVEE